MRLLLPPETTTSGLVVLFLLVRRTMSRRSIWPPRAKNGRAEKPDFLAWICECNARQQTHQLEWDPGINFYIEPEIT